METKDLVSGLIVTLALLSGCAGAPPVDEQLRYAADPNRISARVHTQRYLFDACRNVGGTEKLDGTLVVRFRVDANGRPSSPHIFETIGQSSLLDRCLEDAALKLQFDPMPQGMVASVEYPLTFGPAYQLEKAGAISKSPGKKPREARRPRK